MIDWDWPGVIARGKPLVLAGEKGGGKSTVTCDIAARKSRRQRWPWGGGGKRAAQEHVIIMSAEDDIEDTIVPRLETMGADMSYVHFVVGMRNADEIREFDLLSDLGKLEDKIMDLNVRVGMAIMDPITAYVPLSVNQWMNGQVRRVMAPMGRLGQRLSMTPLGITHFNKREGTGLGRVLNWWLTSTRRAASSW